MRLEKTSINAEIRGWLTGAAYIILVDYRGLPVRRTNELRKQLARLPARMHVVPNRICRRVMAELKWEPAAEAFVGPTALIAGSGDVVVAAKLLKAFAAEHRLPIIKLGRFEGRFLAPADMEILVQLPSRPVLYAMLAGTLAAPLGRLAGVLHQKVASLVYVLQAVRDKKNAVG